MHGVLVEEEEEKEENFCFMKHKNELNNFFVLLFEFNKGCS